MGRIDIDEPPIDPEPQAEPPAATNKRQGEWKRIVPGLIISVISLVIVFYLAKPAQLYQALRLANYRLVVLAVLGGLVWLFVRTLAWRTLLQNKASFSQVFFTVNEGYLLNNVLPFRLGEIARTFLLSVKTQLSFWQIFPTVVIERILDLAFAVGLLLITLPFVVGGSWARPAALSSAMIVLGGLVALYLLARNRKWAMTQFERISTRWKVLSKIGGHTVEAFFDGLGVLTDGRLFLRAVFWIFLNWLIALGQYYLFLLAFVPETNVLWPAFTLSVAALGFAAPSSPGGFGVYEAAVVASLAIFGIPTATALAFALTAHLSQYLIVGIFGAIGLARDGESLIGVYGRVRGISR